MIIIGNGLVANSFFSFKDKCKNSLIFASGVSNSCLTDEKEYSREKNMLKEALLRCEKEKLKIVYFSSAGEVYGSTGHPAKETDPVSPQSLYGYKKIEFEEFIKEADIEYLILRVPNLVGRNQNQHQLFPSLIKQVLQGKVTVFQNAWRDLLDVEDLSRGSVELLRLGVSRQTLNFVSGISIPLIDIVFCIIFYTKIKCLINLVPKGAKHQFSNEKLSTFLPWVRNYFDKEYYKKVINKYLRFYVPK